MSFTISKCFSILVASGHGQRCPQLREKMHQTLLQPDLESGKLKVLIHKFEKKTMPETYRSIALELQHNIEHLYIDIEDKFFITATKDKKYYNIKDFPKKLNYNDENHIWLFCLLLERLMISGRWTGNVALS